jgi:agmatinase
VFSIDVDGLDPALVPGILLPAPGGIGYQQMITLIRGVAARATIVGAAFVEFVPEKDVNGYGARVIARLASVIIATIGHQRIDANYPATS